MKIPSVSIRLQRLAPQLGIRLVLEPDYGFAGQLMYPNGKVSYYYHGSLDINPAGTAKVIRDKAYTSHFLRQLGFRTPVEQTFFSARNNKRVAQKRYWSEAKTFADTIGYPVVIKANSLSLGMGVFMVHRAADFEYYAQQVLALDRVGIVQKAYSGKDYRIVVYKNKIFAAYQRLPLSVVGDGQSTIATLIDNKKDALKTAKKDALLEATDKRIQAVLNHKKYTLDSVLSLGESLELLENANLSDGGVAIDYTDRIHPYFEDIAVRATRDMGLTFCGVDIICSDLSEKDEQYVIIELNSSPGVDGFAAMSSDNDAKVDELYLDILQTIGKG